TRSSRRTSATATAPARSSAPVASPPCRTRFSASSARRKRKMASGADRRLFWGTAAGVVALDIVTKIVAVATLARRPLELVSDYVVLRLVYNRGAAFGLDLGDASRWIFLGLAIVALVVLV